MKGRPDPLPDQMGFPSGLDRFHQAQAGGSGPSNADALREIQAGRKVSHWIWYVLPQLAGLGHSAMARRYGITGVAEAQAYLADPVLGPRLAEITAALAEQLKASGLLVDMLGELDARKAVSSLTLFERAANGSPGGEPWIRQFLASAVTMLATAEAQGLTRCPFTLARLEAVPGPYDPHAPGR